MKKVKVLIICSLFVLLLGCSKTATKTTTCTYEKDAKVVLNYQKDKLTRLTSTQKSDISSSGYTDKEAKAKIDEFSETFKDIAGYTYTYTLKDGILNETTSIDYQLVDFPTLIEKGYYEESDIKKDSNKKQYISYKDIKTSLTSYGYTCK